MASSTAKNRSQSNNKGSKKTTAGTSGTRKTNAAKQAGGAKNSKSKAGSSAAKKSTRSAGSTPVSSSGKAVAQSNPLKDEIVLLLALACTIILLLSNFNMAGSVGQGIKWLMFGLFGVAAYIVPFIVAGSILFMLANKDIIGVMRIKAAAVYILSVIAAAVWQRITNTPDIKSSVGVYFTYCSEHKTGGGLFGGLLCMILSPLGVAGTMVILIILAIICVIVITEKSFIGGIRSGGHRFVKEAREDYSAYKQHSATVRKDTGISDEEYRAMREEERRQARIRKLEKKEQAIAAMKAKEEAMSNARMNNVVRGVTSDLTIHNTQPKAGNTELDINKIEPVMSDVDIYEDDIYDPLIIPRKHNNTGYADDITEITMDTEGDAGNTSGASDIWEIHADEPKEAYQDEFISTKESDVLSDEADKLQEPDDNGDNEIEAFAKVTEDDAFDTASEGNAGEGSDSFMEPDDIEDEYNDGSKEENGEAMSASKTPHSTEVSAGNYDKKYKFPPISLLNRNTGSSSLNLERENRNTAITLKQTLQNFGVKVDITDISCGPAVTRYELKPELGVKVSKIVSLADDIKLSLAAADIRIEAPIPGKSAIGIEVPNKEAGSVFLRELIENDAFKNNSSKIAFAAGKDIAGKTIVADIAKMPHLLIAGATGSGKSVCINTIIMSILYKARPDEVRLIMVDPKVVELSTYNGIPHLLLPVVTDPKKAAGALNWAVDEMTKRYKLFADMGVRNLKGYNDAVERMEPKEGEPSVNKLPQIVIIVDELADLMMVAPGEVEDAICRLAQLARAAGIHMVIATQRPSVNVITGLIKANVPSRIAFSVSSGVDSRTILDMNGAEKLLGKGDMLYFPSNIPKPIRVQGAFVSDEEVARVVEFLKENMTEAAQYDESIADTVARKATDASTNVPSDDRDSLFVDAGYFVIEKEKGSIGMLQRQFKIGFNRAGRIMDQLSEAGVVGPEIGTKPRKILMTHEEFVNYINNH